MKRDSIEAFSITSTWNFVVLVQSIVTNLFYVYNRSIRSLLITISSWLPSADNMNHICWTTIKKLNRVHVCSFICLTVGGKYIDHTNQYTTWTNEWIITIGTNGWITISYTRQCYVHFRLETIDRCRSDAILPVNIHLSNVVSTIMT
jgi:hypothetical protein